jgi:hypothetical protein
MMATEVGDQEEEEEEEEEESGEMREAGDDKKSTRSSTQATATSSPVNVNRHEQHNGNGDDDGNCAVENVDVDDGADVDDVKEPMNGTCHRNFRQLTPPPPQQLVTSASITLSPPAFSPTTISVSPASSIRRSKLRTIVVSTQDIEESVSFISIVDPWVARLRNNDEYLTCGIDFSNGTNFDGRWTNQHRPHHEHPQHAQQQQHPQQLNPLPMVGDLGAQRLSHALLHNTRLLYLNLSNNDIGNDGAVALANCLFAPITNTMTNSDTTRIESKTSLQILDLSHNHISSTHAAIAFAQALAYNTSLREINLDYNRLKIEGILLLLDGLMNNATLTRLRVAYNYCTSHPEQHQQQQQLQQQQQQHKYQTHIRETEKNVVDDIAVIIEPNSTSTVDFVKESIDSDGGDDRSLDDDIILIKKIQNVLRRCAKGESALEVLEMHGNYVDRHKDDLNNMIADYNCNNNRDDCDGCHDKYGGDANDAPEIIVSTDYVEDNLDTLSRKNMLRLLCSMHGIDDNNDDKLDLTNNVLGKFGNHRLRRLTLPDGRNKKDNREGAKSEEDNLVLVHQFRRVLQFNSFYYPILQLNEVLLNLPSLAAEQWRRHWMQTKLPNHLKVNEQGALIGLLDEIENKLLPMVISFASCECSLEVVWNVLRFRPDVFAYAGEVNAVLSTHCTELDVDCATSISLRRNSGRRMPSVKRCCIS